MGRELLTAAKLSIRCATPITCGCSAMVITRVRSKPVRDQKASVSRMRSASTDDAWFAIT